MKNNQSYQAAQQALKEGQLSKALDCLLEALPPEDKSQKEQLLFLKSKFEFHRNQYEVKGILTDREFNIHYSKTLVGIQDIMQGLQTRPGQEHTAKKRVGLLPVLLGILLLSVIGLVSYRVMLPVSATAIVAQEEEQKESAAKVVDSLVKQEEEKEEKPPVNKKGVEQKRERNNTKLAKEPEKQPETSNDPVEKEPTKEEKVVVPPVKTFTVNIIRNSNMSDAKIYVDGQPAIILSNTLILTTIQVKQKEQNHVFELRNDQNICKEERFITTDNQKIIFNC